MSHGIKEIKLSVFSVSQKFEAQIELPAVSWSRNSPEFTGFNQKNKSLDRRHPLNGERKFRPVVRNYIE